MHNHKIKNFDNLATTKYRKDVLLIAEAGYESIDNKKLINKEVKLENDNLIIKGQVFNLKDFENIYVVGFGKVVRSVAFLLENILKDRIKEGAVVGISGEKLNIIETYKGTHPLPSKVNFNATERIKDISKKATENDLVIVIIGGGGSALLCSSEEERVQGERLYNNFLDSGGDVRELNIIRKHISNLKGGGLAKILYPATVIGLVFSDIPGEDYSAVASGPTYKDQTTIQDAKNIIDKYKLGNFDLIETPKENKFFEKIHNIVLVSNKTAITAMKKKAEEMGYDSVDAGCELYFTPEDTMNKLIEKSRNNNVVVAGGETRLVIPKECGGKGGRNDYLALEAIDHIKDNQIFIAFASDGHDNSESAGAIIDNSTKEKMKELDIEIESYKTCLDSFTFFEKVGGLIFTDQMETNVSDLMILLTYKKDD